MGLICKFVSMNRENRLSNNIYIIQFSDKKGHFGFQSKGSNPPCYRKLEEASLSKYFFQFLSMMIWVAGLMIFVFLYFYFLLMMNQE